MDLYCGIANKKRNYFKVIPKFVSLDVQLRVGKSKMLRENSSKHFYKVGLSLNLISLRFH